MNNLFNPRKSNTYVESPMVFGTSVPSLPSEIACICGGLDPCVCGLQVPESDATIADAGGQAQSDGFQGHFSFSARSRNPKQKAAKGSPLTQSLNGLDHGGAEDASPSDGVDVPLDVSLPPTLPSSEPSHFTFGRLKQMKFNDLNLSRQDKMQPPDLEAQQHAALVLASEELKHPRRGASKARAPSDADLPSDEAEVVAAYCEVVLGEDLVAACDAGDEQSVEVLLDEHGLDLDAHDRAGRTPLVACASAGHTRLMCSLIARGASIDMPDHEGRTAFWWACANGHGHAAAALLDFGAATTPAASASPITPTPFAAAVAAGHEGVVTLVLDRASSGAPSVAHALRAQVHKSLASYAAEMDQGDIARAIYWFLDGDWTKGNPNAAEADVRCTVPGSSDAMAAGDLDVCQSAASPDKPERGGLFSKLSNLKAYFSVTAPEGGDEVDGGAKAIPEDESSDTPDFEYDPETGIGTRGHPIWHRIPGWLNDMGGPSGVVTQGVLDEIAELAAHHSPSKRPRMS